jgi:hypothetical protein
VSQFDLREGVATINQLLSQAPLALMDDRKAVLSRSHGQPSRSGGTNSWERSGHA